MNGKKCQSLKFVSYKEMLKEIKEGNTEKVVFIILIQCQSYNLNNLDR